MKLKLEIIALAAFIAFIALSDVLVNYNYCNDRLGESTSDIALIEYNSCLEGGA